MGDTFWICIFSAIEVAAIIFAICLCRIAPECPPEMEETDWSWPNRPHRYIDLPETEYERAEAIQEAARNVG